MISDKPALQDCDIKEAEAVATTTATEHAQDAEALMQQIRPLGPMPKEYNDPEECRLAHDLRKACASGLMNFYEQDLDIEDAEIAIKSRPFWAVPWKVVRACVLMSMLHFMLTLMRCVTVAG